MTQPSIKQVTSISHGGIIFGNNPITESIDSLLTNSKWRPQGPSGQSIGSVVLQGRDGQPDTQASVLRAIDKYKRETYSLVVDNKVVAAFLTDVMKKDESGLYQENNLVHSGFQPLDFTVQYGVGDKATEQAEFLNVNYVYVSDKARFANLGEATIQTMVEASLQAGCGGKVKVDGSYQSSCAFYEYGFRSTSPENDVLIAAELNELATKGKPIDIQEKIGATTMFLPEESIDSWKANAAKSPILPQPTVKPLGQLGQELDAAAAKFMAGQLGKNKNA